MRPCRFSPVKPTGRAFRLIGIGAHDLVGAREVNQSDLFASLSPAEDRSIRRLTRCGRSSARAPSSGDAGSAPGSSARDLPRSSKPAVPLVRALQRVCVPPLAGSGYGPARPSRPDGPAGCSRGNQAYEGHL